MIILGTKRETIFHVKPWFHTFNKCCYIQSSLQLNLWWCNVQSFTMKVPTRLVRSIFIFKITKMRMEVWPATIILTYFFQYSVLICYHHSTSHKFKVGDQNRIPEDPCYVLSAKFLTFLEEVHLHVSTAMAFSSFMECTGVLRFHFKFLFFQ
jgi:hypothetical protein